MTTVYTSFYIFLDRKQSQRNHKHQKTSNLVGTEEKSFQFLVHTFMKRENSNLFLFFSYLLLRFFFLSVIYVSSCLYLFFYLSLFYFLTFTTCVFSLVQELASYSSFLALTLSSI